MELEAMNTDVLQAGAMTLLDTEPLDGVDYTNGVLGYISLV